MAMKHLLVSLAACLSSLSPALAQSSNPALPRIAIAGLGIESSTFSPAVTHEDAFHARYSGEVFNAYPFLLPMG